MGDIEKVDATEDPALEPKPAIILVEPQMAENIGAAARAMHNCGLEDLRLIAPRDGWPNDAARPMASGADVILDNVRVFDTFQDATADLERLYATTARHRDMTAVEMTPRRAAQEVRRQASSGVRSGLLFGRERIGLTNEEVTRCEAMVVAPLNPAFTSLNLAQAVLLIGWEWRMAADTTPERVQLTPDTRPATRQEYEFFFNRLEATLDSTAFFREPDMRPVQWRKIRSLFHRAECTEQEVRILHGVLSALEGKRLPKPDAGCPDAGRPDAGDS